MTEYTEATQSRPSTESASPKSTQGTGDEQQPHKKHSGRHGRGRNKNRQRPPESRDRAPRAEEQSSAPSQPRAVAEATAPSTRQESAPTSQPQGHKSSQRGGKKHKNKPHQRGEERRTAQSEPVSEAMSNLPADPKARRNPAPQQHSKRDRDRSRKSSRNQEVAPHIPEDSIFAPPPLSGSSSKALSPFDDFGVSIKNDDSYLDDMPLDPTLDAVFADTEPAPQKEIDGPEIIGVRFQSGSKVYYFDPKSVPYSRGQHAVVETAQGIEYGEVVIANTHVSEESVVSPLRPALRVATAEDDAHHADNRRRQDEAYKICLKKIENHGLDMKLVEAQYTFDNSKLIFFFTSAGRVDFRELVKDLASVFRTRIELRQIGIRDESKMVGGFGVCGRKLCCSSFLPNFAQVSIKMAKEQGLSLNSSKISGACGRLMCCLRFEQETYEREIALMPPPDSIVETVDGRGVILDIFPISGSVKVKITDKPDLTPKNYKLSEVRVITLAPRKGADSEDQNQPTDGN